MLLKKGEYGSAIYYMKEDGTMDIISKPAVNFDDYKHLSLVDTTGAGDCFTGAFAVKLLQGASYADALKFAN